MGFVVGLNTFFLLFVLAVSGGLAFFVLFNNPRAEANRYFAYLLAATALWIISSLMYLNIELLEWSLVLREISLSLMAGWLLYFSFLWPRVDRLPPYWVKGACLVSALGVGTLSLLGGVSWVLPLYAGIAVLSSLVLIVVQGRRSARSDQEQFFKSLVGRGLRQTGLLYLCAAVAVVGTFGLFLVGQLRFLLSSYVILANLVLGNFVLFQNPKSRINLSFFLITIGIILWTAGVYLFWNLADVGLALFGGRLAFFGGALIPAFLLFFILVFPRQLKPITLLQWLAIGAPVILFTVLIGTGLILKEVSSTQGGIERIYGPAYPLFSVYYLLYLPVVFYDLYRKERILAGFNRIQVRYVFLAFGLSALIAVTTNLILPSLGIGTLSFIGPHATLILVGVMAYAILKHRLLSVEVVIQQSTVYGTATILIMAFYAGAVMISEVYLRRVIGYTSLVVTALAALMIAVVYQPLVRLFQTLTDRLFFRGRYDYQTTLRQISQQIASVIRLEELTKLIVTSFVDTMKVSEISFLLRERDGEHFRSVPLAVERYQKIEIDTGSPIISWLAGTRDILVRDEVDDELNRPADGADRKLNLGEVRDEVERLGISVWVPIISKEELIGIIALGHKLSGDVFTAEDVGLLGTLANQTAVALDNARLYDEVVEMKNYNEKILQSMVSGVLTVDNRGRIVTYNQTAAKITGRPLAEVMGKTCEESWGKRGTIVNVIENTLNQGKVYVNFQSGIASPERGLVPVAFSSTLLLDHAGKKIGALLTIQDISEVKELEDKVRQADKLAALATMAAGMAHEIKNPLSSLKVLAQLLPKKLDDLEYRQKMSEIIPREINRIDRIVESLLGFARATALTFEPADINAILEENVKYFTDQAADNEVKIKTSYATLPPVEVDKSQITQVFSNLMLNAIQAMKNGGELTIETSLLKDADGLPRSVKVRVADTGYGIPEETLKKLFDPFFTTKYGGTGLGLTISHSIVDGHKGYIGVESRVGKGTAFTVTLPVSQALL